MTTPDPRIAPPLGDRALPGGAIASDAVGEDDRLPSGSFRGHFVHLVRASWLFRIGLGIVAVSLLLTAAGPYLARYPLEEATARANQPPSAAHWFGTDVSGFDVFSRVIAAPRVDVTIALGATAFSFALGSLLGLLTSYFRGWLGELVMRGTDMVQAFPLFVFAIIVVVMTGRNMPNIIFVVALLNAPIYLRLMRSQVLSLRERAFVEAARASGNSELSVAFRHVVPNAISPGLAHAPITGGLAILVTAGLSFIGAGIRPPAPEWGAMIASGAGRLVLGDWWTSVFPGLAISITVFGFAIVGEMLRSLYYREGG